MYEYKENLSLKMSLNVINVKSFNPDKFCLSRYKVLMETLQITGNDALNVKRSCGIILYVLVLI